MADSQKKGAKKGRRFNRPRSAAAQLACAKRKTARRVEQDAAHRRNLESGTSPWQEAKARRQR